VDQEDLWLANHVHPGQPLDTTASQLFTTNFVTTHSMFIGAVIQAIGSEDSTREALDCKLRMREFMLWHERSRAIVYNRAVGD
jgi:hypothetical protein